MEISIRGLQTEEFRCQKVPPGQHGFFVFCFAVLGAELRGPLKSDKCSTANSISNSKVKSAQHGFIFLSGRATIEHGTLSTLARQVIYH